jgi:thiol-disulfide isomerase/thioredoxin
MSILASKENRITVAVIIFVLLLASYFAYQAWKSNSIEESQNPARQALANDDQSGGYTDINGNQVNLEDYLGRVIVVNSWASWSPVSSQEITLLDSMASQYNTDEVIFLAINRMEPAVTAERYINRFSETDTIKLLLDPTDHFYQSIGGYSMPETVIYNQSGEVHHHFRGDVNQANVTEKINELLQYIQ